MIVRLLRLILSLVVVISVTLLISGCTTINRMSANIGLRFTEKNIMPALFSDDDVQMSCINGQALGPLIYAVGAPGIGANNNQMFVLAYSAAASCAEQSALESELRYMRASRSNQIEEAQDARIEQKRWAGVASRRQYRAYQSFQNFYEEKYSIKIGEECPKFAGDFDELVFMLGAVTGIQAVVNDINSQNSVGVPKDIAAKVERAMQCLDSNKWWGVPNGVRAAVWSLLPGAGEGKDPWATMKESMRIGQHEGVRLAYSLYTLSAYAKSDDARLRDSLKMYAATRENSDFKVDPRYKMFDKLGEQVILGISDRYWTDHVGARTPADGIGKFWDELEVDPSVGVKIDDLL
jgi:hypothetical protein